jgi:hypothetical protein
VPSDDRPALPTAPREHDERAQTRGRWARRSFAVVVFVFLVLTAVGLFGERDRTTSVESGPYEVVITYPQVTRPGLSAVLEFEIRRTDGEPLPDQVTIETTAEYLRLWDDHAVEPTPDVMRGDGDDVVWVLLPEGDATELTVVLDARIDPSLSWGRSGRTNVYADDERIATLRFKTWLAP